jgi:hypothetical protein
VFDPLTPEQTAALGDLLEALVQNLDPERVLRVEHLGQGGEHGAAEAG